MPCLSDCRRHVRLPLVVIVCCVEIVFLTGGWQFCVVRRAPENTTVVTVELLQHSALLRRGSFPLSPTELAIEFAVLLVEVAVAGWSRHCVQSSADAVFRGCTATFLVNDDTACQWSKTRKSTIPFTWLQKTSQRTSGSGPILRSCWPPLRHPAPGTAPRLGCIFLS